MSGSESLDVLLAVRIGPPRGHDRVLTDRAQISDVLRFTLGLGDLDANDVDYSSLTVVDARLRAAETFHARGEQVLADHRRLRNVRSCSGCGWQPDPIGRTGDPGVMERRHAAFNQHLLALLLTEVTRVD